MPRSVLAGILAVIITLAGCASRRVVGEPGKITLQAAMEEVATGLNRMYTVREDFPKSGLVPDEVTVVFNISATGTDQGKLYVETGGSPADALKIVKSGGEIGSQIQATRGNQVTIKFSNVLFTPKDRLLTIKTASEVSDLLKALKESGITLYLAR
jgi:hypothetical protein